MQNVIDAAHALVHSYPGGAPALAPRVGMGAQVLINKVNPTNENNHLRLDEAVRLESISGDHRILFAHAATLGYVCLPAPDAGVSKPDDLLRVFNRLYSALGEFSGHTDSAIADDHLDSGERAQLHDDTANITGLLLRALACIEANYGRGRK